MSRVRVGREWVSDPDPYASLTGRQRELVEAVREFDGNRSRAARALGITVQTVQWALRCARVAGVRVPSGARRGRDLHERRRAS